MVSFCEFANKILQTKEKRKETEENGWLRDGKHLKDRVPMIDSY